MSMIADAIINVRLKTPAEGGRKSAITGQVYGCPLFVDGEAFDCRIALDGRTLQLGQIYELRVTFLRPDLVKPLLSPGKAVTLWEGKDIASGHVLRVL